MQEVHKLDSERRRPNVILDCDPGIDDAIALHLIADEHRKGVLWLDGIVAVAGNVRLDFTGRNAAFVAHEVGLGDVPVVRGAVGPIVEREAADASKSSQRFKDCLTFAR